LLLVFSLALNVAFVSIAAVRPRREAPPHRLQAPPADFTHRWHGRRAALLGRHLGLDRPQRQAIRRDLAPLRPALGETRGRLATARHDFAAALRRGDLEAARQARRRLSEAQAELDSLSAEAMFREVMHLRPHQRDRYLHRTF
jgi:Spy/CpxP family protein refolding chaperone